jgi:hypothetical protein
VNRAAQSLRLAARSLHHSQGALGGFLRRIKERLGVQAASTAMAHKLARIVYLALKNLDMLVIRKNAHRFSVALVGVETWSNLSTEAQSPNTLRIHRPFQF